MRRNYIYISLLCVYILWADTPRINLFHPYDILLLQPLVALPELQISLGYERLFDACGMQADDEERCSSWRKCENVLQLYQDKQNALAAFKGTDIPAAIQSAFLFSLDDDNGTHALFIPHGKLSIDNIMLYARYAWCNGVTFGLYLPIIHAQLKNVQWKQVSTTTCSFESQNTIDIIKELESIGHMHLFGWKRHGLGDLCALFTWDRFYFQNKPWLKNVHLGLRGGLLFPTGVKQNEDLLFAFPFGNNGSLSVIGGATLELWYGRYGRFGLDGEFTSVFGTCRQRRIKTDRAQTDLFFLTKVGTFKAPGFMQHYTIFAELFNIYKGLSFKAAYQYTKHNEDHIFLNSDHYIPQIAHCAESLQEWTMHNGILMAKYDFFEGHANPRYYPSLMVFYKNGFNGKRAVLGETVGIQLIMNF